MHFVYSTPEKRTKLVGLFSSHHIAGKLPAFPFYRFIRGVDDTGPDETRLPFVKAILVYELRPAEQGLQNLHEG
jgi:hypothetical protein